MQQADRDHIDVVDRGNRPVERFDLSARPVESATHLEPRAARHEGRRSVDVLVVERRPRLARDLDDVREPAGGDEGDAAELALEQRVGRHRRPVRQQLGRVRGDLRDRGTHGDTGIVGRRRHLDDRAVVADQVGEGPARVHPDAHGARFARGSRAQAPLPVWPSTSWRR